ncbi:meiotic nuclear division protein 1 homolog [Takifugu flavidus]|uniref:Meiotic nuclear division protein 1 homolog n=1 Tax=Takifugu flavidus TaxID=433684 RepID=A0A5C6MWZ7_9TELE|nr:meiotic nuclear division protein 1 homolog [Takifugu flavidus]TWW58848.1 Meiotic nuclear division protein 1 -like protein [Takifugu flavidus]
MSKKKGLSLEEKRTRMMEIFFETKDVFQLKDIEKIAPKTKGISPMTVKEVLQSLVDDNMVDCERVGTSNYYWAFPSKALHARKCKLEELQQQDSQAKQRKASLVKAVEKAKEGRQDTKERSSLLKELKDLREEKTRLLAQLDQYKDCDPEVVEDMRKSNVVAKAAVSRWTDNIFSIKSWTKKKFAFDENRINKAFGIPEDFDYLD